MDPNGPAREEKSKTLKIKRTILSHVKFQPKKTAQEHPLITETVASSRTKYPLLRDYTLNFHAFIFSLHSLDH